MAEVRHIIAHITILPHLDFSQLLYRQQEQSNGSQVIFFSSGHFKPTIVGKYQVETCKHFGTKKILTLTTMIFCQLLPPAYLDCSIIAAGIRLARKDSYEDNSGYNKLKIVNYHYKILFSVKLAPKITTRKSQTPMDLLDYNNNTTSRMENSHQLVHTQDSTTLSHICSHRILPNLKWPRFHPLAHSRFSSAE